MITAEMVINAQARLDNVRIKPSDQLWILPPDVAEKLGITREMVDASGMWTMPDGRRVQVFGWGRGDEVDLDANAVEL